MAAPASCSRARRAAIGQNGPKTCACASSRRSGRERRLRRGEGEGMTVYCDSCPRFKARAIAEYHEDMGDVLWWKFPIEEPPYVGSPLVLGYTVEVVIRTHGHEETHQVLIGGWPGYHT